MVWTIRCGENLVYDRNIISDNGERFYDLIAPELNETNDGFCSLKFSAKEDSAAVAYMQKLYPYTHLYLNGSLYWKGRLLTDTPDIRGVHQYYVEDFLAVLRDSVVRPYEFFGTPTQFLEYLIEQHNNQVETHQKFVAVVCDVVSSFETGNISRSSESYASTWSVIKDKLLNTLGGYMWVSYAANGDATLHYSSAARDTSTQTVELGENLASIAIKDSMTKFYTACIPIGKKDDETGKYLTIKDVNNGKDFLINDTAAARYGVIFAPIEETTWEDTTEPANLLSRGNTWLQMQSAKAVQEIDIRAVDLGSSTVENFLWLDSVRVVVPTRGLDAQFVIESLNRQLDKPSSAKIKMGYSGRQITSTGAASAATNARQIKEIKSDYVTNGEARTIAEAEIHNSTWIQQEAERIVSTALQEYTKTSDLETMFSSIQSQFSQLASQISLEFTTIQQTVANNSNSITDTNATLDQYRAWFWFLSSGALVIGNSSSPVQMVLKNDVLYFCTDPENVNQNNAIAYFAAGQLYVNFINVQNLTVGTNGRWLDVRIVGTGVNTCALFSGRLS